MNRPANKSGPGSKMLLTVAAAFAFGSLVAPGSPAQSAVPRPEFDAASIRLNVDGGPYVFNGMKSLGTFSSKWSFR